MEFLCINIILAFLACCGAVTLEATNFPIPDCSQRETDLLFITDTALSDGCVGPPEVITLFLEIIGLFLPSDKPVAASGLRAGLAIETSTGVMSVLNFSANAVLDQTVKFSNLTACNTSMYPRIRKPVVHRVGDFIRTAFSEAYGRRVTARHLVVMLISNPDTETADDVKKLHKTSSENNVLTFVIVVDADKVYQTYFPNTMSVAGFSDLVQNQRVFMALCKKCLKNWFWFEQQKPFYYLSCYYLDINNSTLNNWYRAADRCRKMASALASLETHQEISFLQRHLYEVLAKQGGSTQEWEVFIGLRRDLDSLNGRFQWINGRPVVASHWLDNRLLDELTRRCGTWRFQRIEFLSDVMENLTEHSKNDCDGWDSIACGTPQGHASLCEVSLDLTFGETGLSVDILPASNESFISALNRGEFLEFKGEIVSTSQIPGDYELSARYYSNNNRFPLFRCEDNKNDGTEIAYSYVCDYIHNCPNKRDEELCLYRKCDPTREFECSSGQCVPLEALCDMYSDCLDGSDEKYCTEYKLTRCAGGVYVPKHRYTSQPEGFSCNGSEATVDKSTSFTLQDNCSIICSRTFYAHQSQFGDDVLSCTDPGGSVNETLGKLEGGFTLLSTNSSNLCAPRCIYSKDRYKDILGCRDLSHLWNCEAFICPEGYAKCPDSYCIPILLVLDGNMDCPLGEDEQESTNHSCSGNFACGNSNQCLHPELVCNGNPDCPFRDDELNCNVSCQDGFRCIAGTVSVANYDMREPLQSLAFIDDRTRYLDLSGVDVTSAFAKQEKRQLRNIIAVVLTNCKITTVEDSFVSDVTDLQSVYSLDIRYNRIRKVPTNSIFRFMTNLRVLTLSYNQNLVEIEEKAFLTYYKKSQLEYLYLSYTSISILHSSVLDRMTSLKVLDLSHTLISHLYSSFFPPDFKLRILYLRSTTIVGYNSSSFNGLTILEGLYTDTYGLCCPQIRGQGISEQVCHATKDPISSCFNLIEDMTQLVLLWIVGIIAVLGNLVVIVCRFVMNKGAIAKAYGMFVTHLGISDFIMGVYLLTIAGADLYYRGVYITNNIFWKRSMVCHIAGFLSTLSSETSAFFVLLVTIDRYFVLKFPFGQYGFSRRSTVVATALAWTCGFVLALIPSLPNFNSWTIFYANGMCLGLPLTVERLGGWEYSVFIFVGLNTTMFVVIAAGQYSIYKALSENRAAKTAIHNSKRRSQDIAVAKQLFLVVLTDFLCYFPVGLMGLLAMTGHDIGSDVYAWSAVLVLPVNSAINPMLYTVPVIQNKWKQFKRQHLKGRDNSLNAKALATLSKAVDYNLRN